MEHINISAPPYIVKHRLLNNAPWSLVVNERPGGLEVSNVTLMKGGPLVTLLVQLTARGHGTLMKVECQPNTYRVWGPVVFVVLAILTVCNQIPAGFTLDNILPMATIWGVPVLCLSMVQLAWMPVAKRLVRNRLLDALKD